MDRLDFIKDLYFKYGAPIKKCNIFGIRDAEGQKKDIWNDVIGYFMNDTVHFFRGTTDPGIHWTQNPMNKKGTAHLCLGHHKEMWKIDKHRGQYTALCNKWGTEKVKIWRDFDKDAEPDHENDYLDYGWFGINLHRASAYKILSTIGKYSAGCQVILDSTDFDKLINDALFSKQKKFDYFLFDKDQIPFFNDLSNELYGKKEDLPESEEVIYNMYNTFWGKLI